MKTTPPRSTRYVVTAYRWGQRNGHSYVVGVYPSLVKAKKQAESHVGYRGGKYGCEVVEAHPWTEDNGMDALQVEYIECPYFGMAGNTDHFQPACCTKIGWETENTFFFKVAKVLDVVVKRVVLWFNELCKRVSPN